MATKVKRGRQQYSSGFAGEALPVVKATEFAKKIAKTATDVAQLTGRIRELADDYKTYSARIEPAPAQLRASLRTASRKAGELNRFLNSLDWACREKVAFTYVRALPLPKGARRPSLNSDLLVVSRLETLLAEAAGYERLPTREDETLYLRTLVTKLALEWEQYSGERFEMGKQAFGSRAGEWIKGIVAEIDPDVPKTKVNGALAAALRNIRRDRLAGRASD